MIAAAMVEEVRRLLSQGVSHRDVSRRTGVSRSTINQIAQGRRRDRPDRIENEYRSLRFDAPPARCRDCGGLVYLPCQLCALRKLRRRS